MKPIVLETVNKQINEELFSAYMYLAIAAGAEALGLPGFSSWFKVQAQEEIDHGMGFFNHLAHRHETIDLQALAKPELSLATPEELVKASLNHEKHITSKIHDLVKLAEAESDPALGKLLEWYVDEQKEEEESIGELLEKVNMIGADKIGLETLDKELGQRQYHPSSILEYKE